MKKEYILIIDSGIGGLSTLSELLKTTLANYIYYADVYHSPYGSHTKKEILSYLTKIIKTNACCYNIVMVILACNTATTSSIEHLRQIFPNIPIVGTEPAISFASKLGHKNILTLTTPTTAKQFKYQNLKNSLKCNITTLSIPSLAKNVENYLTNKTLINYKNLLKDIMIITKYAKNYDCIVLGCTHYVLIKDLITKFSKKPCIDGNIGVATHANKLYSQLNKLQIKKYTIKFDNSFVKIQPKQKYKKILGQILANIEKL